jgi:hypothetical protein
MSNKLTPFDFLSSINEKKTYLFSEESADTTQEAVDHDSSSKQYPAYMVNRGLSYFIDTVMFANEMNCRPEMSTKMQYDFLYHSVRKKKRFSKWFKREKDSKDLELVKKAYSYNRERAEEALELLSNDDLKALRKSMKTGGLKNR